MKILASLVIASLSFVAAPAFSEDGAAPAAAPAAADSATSAAADKCQEHKDEKTCKADKKEKCAWKNNGCWKHDAKK